jgi:hypothetical protein
LGSQLPQVHEEVTTLIVRGDEGAVEFISTRGGADGNLPAGRLEIATSFEFRHGRIISDISYSNVPSK